MKKLKYKKYYPYIYETEWGFNIDLSEIENEEYPCVNGCSLDVSTCRRTCCFANPEKCDLYALGKEILEEFKQQNFTWKDIVEIRGEYHYEEFPISGLMDDKDTYQIDEFLDAVGRKYNAYPDLIKTEMMYGLDHVDVEVFELGCFINGISEKEID